MVNVGLLLAAVTLIAGVTPLAARYATAELPPLTLAFCRFGTAGTLLLITGRMLGLRWAVPRGCWRSLAGLGLICVPVNQFGFLFGIKLANASHAGIAYALVPVLVFWVSLLLRRISFTARLGMATLLAFVGAAIVDVFTATESPAATTWNLRLIAGDLLLVLAALSWSLFVVLSQPLVKQLGAVQTLTAVFLFGALWQLPLVAVDAAWFELSSFDVTQVSWRAWAGLAYLTLITAYVNYLLWYLVTARYEVTRSAVVTNTHFLITVLAEAALFDQALSPWIVAGSALLLGGIILATRGAAAQPAHVEASRQTVTSTSCRS